MDSRTKNSYQTFLSNFLQFDILAVCPNCSKQAIVKSQDYWKKDFDRTLIKVVCSHCGYNKKLSEKSGEQLYATGQAVDPYFYLPLWLSADFEENTLWAYNVEHLDFLAEHIGAKLRERNGQELYNRSIGSRLPKWMTSKKHREALLKKITELKSK